MKKISKYLKKQTGAIAIVIVLLFLQAYCDLSLPGYISRVVDTGIQLGGIDSNVPEVLKEETFSAFIFMMSEEEQQMVIKAYERTDRENISEKDYDKLVKKYPGLSETALYLLKKVSKSEKEKLEGIFLKNYISLAQFMSGDMQTDQEGITDVSILPESMQGQVVKVIIKKQYEDIGMDTNSIQMKYIIVSGLQMLLLAGLIMVCAIAVGFLAARIGSAFSRDLRQAVFKKVVDYSNTEFDKFSTASLITRSTNDIQQIQMLIIMMLRMIIYAPILGIGGVYKVFQTNTSMTWIVGLAVLVIVGIVFVLISVAMPKFKLMQKLVDKLNLVTREILSGLPVIRAFNTEKHEEERFDKANKDLTKTNLFVSRVMTFMFPIMILVMNAVTILIMWNGGKGIDSGAMQVGDLMAFMQYTMQIIMSFLMLCMMSIMLPRSMVSVGRVAEVLSTDAVIKDKENTVKLDKSKRSYVEFDHVSFCYPGAEEDALHDIHFTAEPGKTTAIIGSTGSGKSTLVNLIPRFYDVTGGSIRVCGKDVRDVSSKELRNIIGFVPQKGILFSGTIDENIRYGNQEASKEEVERAAVIAQAKAFIDEKPEGYESEIAQGGSNVSGGQKQRLAIARAIAKKPDIYIFDDSFSALDYKTDVVLRKMLKEETGDSTVIIVAQRISTILQADQILVLDEGRIVGQGTHTELMSSCEVYRQIAASQLSEKEIENISKVSL